MAKLNFSAICVALALTTSVQAGDQSANKRFEGSWEGTLTTGNDIILEIHTQGDVVTGQIIPPKGYKGAKLGPKADNDTAEAKIKKDHLSIYTVRNFQYELDLVDPTHMEGTLKTSVNIYQVTFVKKASAPVPAPK